MYEINDITQDCYFHIDYDLLQASNRNVGTYHLMRQNGCLKSKYKKWIETNVWTMQKNLTDDAWVDHIMNPSKKHVMLVLSHN